MPPLQIAVLVGSLRRDSYNRRLALAMTRMLPRDVEFKQVPIGALPLYNQDDDDAPGEAALLFKATVAQAQAVLFVTPEYNRSIPGVLKNALDHGSRPYGQSVWAGKPAGVIGASVGTCGTAMAQQHLRNVLVSLDMPTLSQPEAFLHATSGMFDAQGQLGNGNRLFVQQWLDAFLSWVHHHVAH